jgi:hypothetical protein
MEVPSPPRRFGFFSGQQQIGMAALERRTAERFWTFAA